MRKAELYHKQILSRILEEGFLDVNPRPHYLDGTPAHTLSVNHVMTSYDISKGEFPIITLRPIAWKSSVREILWIYKDQTSDLSVLENKYNIHWWNDWESKDRPGTIGQRYGATVKRYDLMNRLLEDIKNNPYGRRHIMSMWQENDFAETDGLMPCCYETIWNVRGEFLDMVLIQRSSDFATAGVINELQYVALLMMVARHTGYKPGVFSHFMANVQIYDRHVEQAKELIKREPVECSPRLVLNPDVKNFYDVTEADFTMEGYPLDEVKAKNPQLKFELGI
ncbi:MAG TPA: thymidylate synthase [Clostridiales bacterium]|nr:thymidylate synthase [Clostridiales bacterium]